MKLHRINPLPGALALLVALAFTAGGCRSGRTASTEAAGKSAAQVNLQERLQAVDASLLPWSNVRMPVTLKLTTPQRLSLSGTMTMVRGRGLSLSLRFMGMVEVGTLTLTTDSLTAVDKYHRLYISESLTDLLQTLPAGISDLQELLMGRPFALGEPSFAGSHPALRECGGGYWMATPKAPCDGWTYAFTFNPANMPARAELLQSGILRAAVTCSDVTADTPAGLMATSVEIGVHGTDGGITIAGQLLWKSSRATWNSPSLTLPAATPREGYRRVTPAALASLLREAL